MDYKWIFLPNLLHDKQDISLFPYYHHQAINRQDYIDVK